MTKYEFEREVQVLLAAWVASYGLEYVYERFRNEPWYTEFGNIYAAAPLDTRLFTDSLFTNHRGSWRISQRGIDFLARDLTPPPEASTVTDEPQEGGPC